MPRNKPEIDIYENKLKKLELIKEKLTDNKSNSLKEEKDINIYKINIMK